MSKFLTLKTVDQVLALIQDLPSTEIETIPLTGGLGRSLGCDFVSPENLPGFDRSTVDGFAVRARDVFGAAEASPALLDLIGECIMGSAPSLTIEPGTAARIWTGGMLPPGADAVVMLEYSRAAGATQIELTRPVAPHDNTIAKDEDVTKGVPLLPAGHILRPQDLGLLAALGSKEINVRRRPRFAVISSGDEVVPMDADLQPGQIRESNSLTLCGLIEDAGGEVENLGLVPDDMDALVDALKRGLGFADAVIVTGGSSAGQRDFTLPAFASLSGWEVLMHGVAMRPGKPTILARNGGRTLWGLPGNPTAAFIVADVFIRELIRVLLGQNPSSFERRIPFRARLSRRVASAQGRRDYIRVRLEPSENPEDFPLAHPLLGPSGLVSNPAKADGLILCHESLEGLDAGQVMDVHLLHS